MQPKDGELVPNSTMHLPPPPQLLVSAKSANSVPPPPAPPPPKKSSSTRSQSMLPGPPPVPSGAFAYTNHKSTYHKFLEATKADVTAETFKPINMFFYGSLSDPEVLQAVLNLSERPTLKPATISGFRIKLWGIYPALVPCQSGSVTGSLWTVTSGAHFGRLVAYETAAYKVNKCQGVSEGAPLKNCFTFCWAGHPESTELEEGIWDLKHYQRYFKPSVTRQR
ncbi:hypothetical protein M011DRAFT_465552 [Sporormia fimetaria CBS 119925]|uniref:Putative gamma-glutamylcyclotransferase n=1 Tax=Sporormia fimetaria CBS 119925 TaxID=1340428 RepID=A0A6A6VIC2_9PLEO|nr:hypothetical protein M011DRAFT_465552 [Sporormia fimetaria CBS 119925]